MTKKLSSKIPFKKIKSPKLISLFSGCGGIDISFRQEGYRVVWVNDQNECALKSFENYFGNITHPGDIADYDPYGNNQIPSADIIAGGFPCQDFSIIWKRPGLNTERGNLYKYFLGFIDAKKPLAFVAENVKGLLSANNRRAISQIIADFEKIDPGYLIKIQLYNFAEYGVPQFRERVIIVGVRMDTGFHFKHPQPTHGPGRKLPYVTAGEALEGVEKVKFNNEKLNIRPRTVEILKRISEGGNFTDIPKGSPYYVKGMISHVYRRIRRNKPAMTIIAAGGGGTWGYHYPEPRPLTNRERARLQTFPDDFEFIGSTTEVRRQIGNAVPPVGMRLVAKELKRLFAKDYEYKDLFALNEAMKRMTLEERLKFDR